MTENYYAIAGVLEAMKNKFGQQSGQTPVKAITPAEFRELCTANGVDDETVWDIYAGAVALVLGMMQYQSDVSLVGVGGLIVQVEDLKNQIVSSVRKAVDGDLVEMVVGTVNLKTGEEVSRKNVLFNVNQ